MKRWMVMGVLGALLTGCAGPQSGTVIRTGSDTSSYRQAYEQIQDRMAALEKPARPFAVALAGMTNATRRGQLVLGQEAGSMLRGELQRSGWFEVVPMPESLAQQGAINLGKDEDAEQQRRRLRSAYLFDYLVDGTVVLLASRERINEDMWKSSKTVQAEAEVEVFLRDPASGRLEHSGHGMGEWAETFTQQSGIGIVDPQFEQKTLRLAIGDAVYQLAKTLPASKTRPVPPAQRPVVEEAVAALVKEMDAHLPAGSLKAAVLSFRAWDNQTPAAKGELVRKTLEAELGSREPVEVLTRDNLKDLQIENRFEAYRDLVKSSGEGAFEFQGADILLRGNVGDGRLFIEAIGKDGTYLYQGTSAVRFE